MRDSRNSRDRRCQRFCSRACRRAMERVWQRERRWRRARAGGVDVITGPEAIQIIPTY